MFLLFLSVFIIFFLSFSSIFTFCTYFLFHILFLLVFFNRFGSVTSFPYIWTRKSPTNTISVQANVLSLFPLGAEIIYVHSCVHTGPANHVVSYAEITSAQEIGHLPLDRATVKNSWRHNSTPIFYGVVMNGKSNLTLHKHIRTTCSCLHNFLKKFWDQSMCRIHLTCNLSYFN